MSIACHCDYDGDGWWYLPPRDYATMPALPRRKRCCSCRALIEPGATVANVSRARSPRSDIEEDIYGDEVPLANWWLCEACADVYFSLEELGYCIMLGDESGSLPQQVRNYVAEMGTL